MSDGYVIGNRSYHLVADGAKRAKCGFDFTDISTDPSKYVKATKTNPDWPTCPLCANADALPEQLKKLIKK